MRWLVRVDLFRAVVEVVELQPGTDLRRALAAGIDRLKREGCRIEGVSYSGTIVSRGGVRHYLSVVTTNPESFSVGMWGPSESM